MVEERVHVRLTRGTCGSERWRDTSVIFLNLVVWYLCVLNNNAVYFYHFILGTPETYIDWNLLQNKTHGYLGPVYLHQVRTCPSGLEFTAGRCNLILTSLLHSSPLLLRRGRYCTGAPIIADFEVAKQ